MPFDFSRTLKTKRDRLDVVIVRIVYEVYNDFGDNDFFLAIFVSIYLLNNSLSFFSVLKVFSQNIILHG